VSSKQSLLAVAAVSSIRNCQENIEKRFAIIFREGQIPYIVFHLNKCLLNLLK
jgi:hypothetical protein